MSNLIFRNGQPVIVSYFDHEQEIARTKHLMAMSELLSDPSIPKENRKKAKFIIYATYGLPVADQKEISTFISDL